MKRLLILFTVLMAVFLVSCTEPKKALLEINKGNTTLAVGASEKLVATITNDVVEVIVWSTDDSNIITVDQTGLVTALKEGSANVKASVASGSFVICNVVVSDLLAGVKEAAYQAVEDTVAGLNKNEYSAQNWFTIQSYLTMAKASIAVLTSEEEITAFKNNIISTILGVSKDALDGSKNAAIGRIHDYVNALDSTSYGETAWMTIKLYELGAVLAVQVATNEIEINLVVQEFQNLVDKQNTAYPIPWFQ